jgi:hypothetical protein
MKNSRKRARYRDSKSIVSLNVLLVCPHLVAPPHVNPPPFGFLRKSKEARGTRSASSIV